MQFAVVPYTFILKTLEPFVIMYMRKTCVCVIKGNAIPFSLQTSALKDLKDDPL